MVSVERVFNQFLRSICIFAETDSAAKIVGGVNTGPAKMNAQILERKLSLVAHNSWKSMGEESAISLNQDSQGHISTSGLVRIPDFTIDPLVVLRLKLLYRGKFVQFLLYWFVIWCGVINLNLTFPPFFYLFQVQFTSATSNAKVVDYVLGYAFLLPTVTRKGALVECESQVDLVMGPGVAPTGELIWDHTQTSTQNDDLKVKLSTILSFEEVLAPKISAAQADQERAADAKLEQLRAEVMQSEHKEKLEKENEALRLQIENEKLKRKRQEIDKKNEQPTEQAIKESAENKEIQI